MSEEKLLLRQEIRDATRRRFRQTMGELRSIAASMAAKGLVNGDEEQYFRDLVAEYFYVERQEAVLLFGVQHASALLSIFRTSDCEILDGDTKSTG